MMTKHIFKTIIFRSNGPISVIFILPIFLPNGCLNPAGQLTQLGTFSECVYVTQKAIKKMKKMEEIGRRRNLSPTRKFARPSYWPIRAWAWKMGFLNSPTVILINKDQRHWNLLGFSCGITSLGLENCNLLMLRMETHCQRHRQSVISMNTSIYQCMLQPIAAWFFYLAKKKYVTLLEKNNYSAASFSDFSVVSFISAFCGVLIFRVYDRSL